MAEHGPRQKNSCYLPATQLPPIHLNTFEARSSPDEELRSWEALGSFGIRILWSGKPWEAQVHVFYVSRELWEESIFVFMCLGSTGKLLYTHFACLAGLGGSTF